MAQTWTTSSSTPEPRRTLDERGSTAEPIRRIAVAVRATVPHSRRQGVLHLRSGGPIADLDDVAGHRARAQPHVRQLDGRRVDERHVHPRRRRGHAVLRAPVRPVRAAACRTGGAWRADSGDACVRTGGARPSAHPGAVRAGHMHGADPVLVRRPRAHPLGVCAARFATRVAAQHRVCAGSGHR